MSMTREGIVLDMPEAEYHSGPELSSTGAKAILDSPALFHWNQTHPQEHKAAYDLGSAVHAKVLGVGWGIQELEFDNYRSKPAQTARDEAREAGLIPMLKHELTEAEDMAEAVLAQPLARALFEQEDGHAEVSMFGTDPDTGVRLRGRFDYLGKHAVDLKTTAGRADERGFAGSVASYKYHVQRGHYLHLHELITGEAKEMVFVMVEKTPPYLVAVWQLSRDFAEMGEKEARVARERYAACVESGEWPGYPHAVQLAKPPVWSIYEHEDKYA